MPRKYSPKGDQRCTACGRKGHNSKNPLCPESVSKASAAKGLRAYARELQARRPTEPGPVAQAIDIDIEAALAAAERVAS